MYLVVKHRKGYRAIPIHAGDDWGMQVTPDINRLRHPLNSKTQQLVSYVRVEHPDIVLMDHEPPVDVAQEELPY